MGQLNRSRGKRTEKRIAAEMGGKRVGVMGGEDLEHPIWSIEVKSRVKSTVHNFMDQAARNCPAGKTPLVRVHKHGSRYADDLICMRAKDWDEWYGRITG